MVVRPITLGETTAAIIQSNTMGIVPKTIISTVLRTLIVVVVRPITLGETTAAIIQSNTMGIVPKTIFEDPHSCGCTSH